MALVYGLEMIVAASKPPQVNDILGKNHEQRRDLERARSTSVCYVGGVPSMVILNKLLNTLDDCFGAQ